jgi:ABC-type spermidine/putrescine transport system permease subunit I
MSFPETGRGRLAGLLLAAPAALLLVVFCVGPFLFVLRLSLCALPAGRGFYQADTWTTENYASALGDPYFREVALFTAVFASGVTALVLLLAVPLALFLDSLPPRAKAVALALVVLPKLASMLVIVYGLQSLLSASGLVNRLLQGLTLASAPVPLSHNLAGAIVGEVYLLLPYAVLVLVVSLGRIDPALAQAARGLGASAWQVFRRIRLPLMLPGLVLAGQLTLLWALGAFVGPLLLGSPAQTTLAVEVQRQTIENSSWPRAATAAVLLLAGVLVVLAIGKGILRSLGARSGR